tara:strand:+ start:38234 stop:39025 length:792 start_codon:yes stop_codon:yes gene_type:complete
MKYSKKNLKEKTKKQKKQRYNNYKSNLISAWQIIAFLCVSSSLSFFLINNGWKLINSEQIKVKGNILFNKKEIISATGMKLPKPLLGIIPKRIEGNLKRKLSLKAVSIHRQIYPKQLSIQILERVPIAYAQRASSSGIEHGVIDKKAQWIPFNWRERDHTKLGISVKGWDPNNRKLIAFILSHRKNLGSSLKKITLNSNGVVTLETVQFNSIILGTNTDLINQQINVLAHLGNFLPKDQINKSRANLDLRDPSKPQLQTLKPQ